LDSLEAADSRRVSEDRNAADYAASPRRSTAGRPSSRSMMSSNTQVGAADSTDSMLLLHEDDYGDSAGFTDRPTARRRSSSMPCDHVSSSARHSTASRRPSAVSQQQQQQLQYVGADKSSSRRSRVVTNAAAGKITDIDRGSANWEEQELLAEQNAASIEGAAVLRKSRMPAGSPRRSSALLASPQQQKEQQQSLSHDDWQHEEQQQQQQRMSQRVSAASPGRRSSVFLSSAAAAAAAEDTVPNSSISDDRMPRPTTRTSANASVGARLSAAALPTTYARASERLSAAALAGSRDMPQATYTSRAKSASVASRVAGVHETGSISRPTRHSQRRRHRQGGSKPTERPSKR
jgi:hypothetical protein